ncbi:MAG: hypothetical protein QXQ64_08380 [Candidatus Bathyarchaeia archaeon]
MRYYEEDYDWEDFKRVKRLLEKVNLHLMLMEGELIGTKVEVKLRNKKSLQGTLRYFSPSYIRIDLGNEGVKILPMFEIKEIITEEGVYRPY